MPTGELGLLKQTGERLVGWSRLSHSGGGKNAPLLASCMMVHILYVAAAVLARLPQMNKDD